MNKTSSTQEENKIKDDKKQQANSKNKWIPLCERDHISPLWIFAICSSQIALSFIWTPLNVLTPSICTKLGLSHSSTSLVMLIGPISGFVLPPIISALSDSTTMKLGRRRIYMIIGEIFSIVGLLMVGFCREISATFNPLSFLIPNLKDSLLPKENVEALFYFVVGEILAYGGGNIANSPAKALSTEVIPMSQRILAVNMCSLNCAIGAMISNFIGAFDLYKYTNLSNENFVLLVSCVVGIFTMFLSIVSTPEERLLVKPKSCNPITVLVDTIRSLDRNIVFILVSVALNNFGCTEFFAEGSNYIAKHIFKGKPNDPDGLYDQGISYFQFLMLIMTISQFIFSFINTKIVDKLGFKNSWTLSMIIQIISNVLLYYLKSKEYLFIPFVLYGFACVNTGSLSYGYVSLHSPPEKLAGRVTLLILNFNVTSLLANIVMNMYLGSLPCFHSNPGQLIAYSSIFLVFSIITGALGYGSPNPKKKEKGE